MSSELRWIVSRSACAFYAADLLRRGRSLGNSSLESVLAEPVDALLREVENVGVPFDRIWDRLVPLAAQVESNRQLAETALRKALGAGTRLHTLAPRLAGRVADLEAAMARARPDLVEQLSERTSVLCQRWEPTALAVLGSIGRLTDPRLVPDRAEVVLVPPFSGGGGLAHLPVNSAWIEAVSPDPNRELPESIRLAWLLAQLNVDLPTFSENLPPARRGPLAGLSMVSPALAAADQLELVRFESALVRTAVGAWAVEPAGPDTAGTLIGWWETYAESRPPFGVALSALDRMLGA